jgi:glycosyltransferase involved in cell wall biosynthesis
VSARSHPALLADEAMSVPQKSLPEPLCANNRHRIGMTTTVPRVTVGMPVYNGEPFVGSAIESILAQTFRDFNLIILDNASTDQTEKVCRSFATKDTRIKYFRRDSNRGAAKNFNRVFELSSSEYFKWATADDLCASHYLQRCVEILDDEPDVALCYAKSRFIDETGAITGSYEDGLNLVSPSAGGRFLQLMFNIGKCNAVYGVMRSSVLRRTRLIGNYVGSDKCLLAELSLLGQFREIPEYLFFRREHPGASSAHKDNASQLEFFDPRLAGRVTMPKWRHFWEHFRSIKRAPVKRSQKVLPTFFLVGSLAVSFEGYARELATAAKQAMSREFKKPA